ncbi:MAG: ketoacyl-ACP synthase III [Desulfobacterales bacterium]|nr:MAG: ketoacyl-ACP synthase III [Desulfobacterales bacterium]
MRIDRKSEIAGLGFSVPDRIVTNKDLEALMDTTDEWIVSRSGIHERRWVSGETGTSDLAIAASRQAMERAGVNAREIDMVIAATITPDYYFPGISVQIQDQLGMHSIGAFDIRAACSGFIYALSVADQFIKTAYAKTVLVVGAEVQSTALNVSTEGRDMAVLFGDGAGAAVLRAGHNERCVLSTHLHSQGKYLKELWCEGPASRCNPRISEEMINEGRHYPSMNGREVFRQAVTRFPEAICEALDANSLSIDDVALIIPHQANLRISQAVAKKLRISMDRVYSNIQRYGNTTAASIPIALAEALDEGKIKEGDILILAAFGAGFTWASAAIRW